MKILLLWPIFHPTPTAAAIRGEAFARHLAARDNRVLVITPQKDSVSRPNQYEGFTVKRMRTYDSLSEKHGFVTSSMVSPFLLPAMRREIRSFQPDLIIASSPAPFLALEGFLSSRAQRIPFVYDMRDSWRQEQYTHRGVLRNWTKRAIERWLCREADLVFCISDSMSKSTISEYGLPSQKVKVVTNGTEPLREVVEPPKKEYDLVFSGYPAEYRNIPELLKGIAVASKAMHIRMLCLGWKESPQEGELRTMLRELGIEENVDLCPPVSHDQVARELSRARFGVTSLSGDISLASAIGTKTYEYLAAGLPVACLSPFPESELRDFVMNNQIGFYSRNAERFARDLVSLLTNEEETARMRRNAREVSIRYYWKSIVDRAFDDYLSIYGGSRR
ncbi:MAG: glycosyltransferase family 4 protein [Thermoplasmata archaeon]